MHEVSLVADLVDECERQAAGRPVSLVRVRYASTIPSEGLHQAFRQLTTAGTLTGAVLAAEPFEVRLECGCGYAGSLGHDDVISGSVGVCPACGDVSVLPRTAELELLEVRTRPRPS
jgi:Zn finger protein HypA/HybF involved in hydrogenase expression